MHQLNFFPLGNADCCRIDLENGKKILFDYADMADPDDEDDLRIDLAAALREDLEEHDKSNYEIVAFTHLDKDHTKRASEFFWLDHDEQYQGHDRVRIDELWVPAAAITEDGCEDDAAVIQEEARHRLRNKKDIRVFSRPIALKEWLKGEGMTLEEVSHLITDAGQVVPGLSTEEDGVEFFTHSPFAKRQNENEVEDRNLDSIVMQATFTVDGSETKLILGSDVNHEVLADIVQITRGKDREDRLEWDVFELPHHCSYTALGPERGEEETEPVPEVDWLFRAAGRTGGTVVSTSKPIPDDDEDDNPPHRQAAAYYKRISRENDGEFKVTMEHPKKTDPDVLIIQIDSAGATIEKRISSVSAGIVTQRSPRAG